MFGIMIRLKKFPALLFLCTFIACNAREIEDPVLNTGENSGRDAGIMLASVNQEVITAREVSRICAETGREPQEVLEGLINHYLLSQHAKKLWFENNYDVYSMNRKALAYRLIEKEVIEPNLPEKMNDSEVLEYYNEKDEYHQPRKRSVMHHLISARGKNKTEIYKKAGPFAQKMYAEASKVTTMEDFRSIGEKYKKKAEELKLYFKTEKIQDIPENSRRLVREFVERTFSIKKPGMAGKPVKTPYGWHLIFVYEEKAAVETLLSEVSDEIRKVLSEKKTEKAFEELMARVESSRSYKVYERKILNEETPDDE